MSWTLYSRRSTAFYISTNLPSETTSSRRNNEVEACQCKPRCPPCILIRGIENMPHIILLECMLSGLHRDRDAQNTLENMSGKED